MSNDRDVAQSLDISEIDSRLVPLVEEVARKKNRVIVENAGTPVAALVSIEELRRWDRLDEERDDPFAVIDRMRAAFADVSTDEIESEVAKAVAEVRAETKAEREKRALAS